MNELKIGDVTVTRIEEMHGPIMPPDQFFPEMPEEAWREHRETLVPDHLGADDGMVRGAFQTWLLRSGGRTVLIDTGIGNDKTRPAVPLWDHLQLDYLGNLARAGVRPGDVDRQRRAGARRGPGATMGGQSHHRREPAVGSRSRAHARIQRRQARLGR